MSGTLADHGIHPIEGSNSEFGSHVDLERLLSGNSINLRDLGAVTDQVKTGLVFRSSQVVSPSQLKRLNIKVSLNVLFHRIPLNLVLLISIFTIKRSPLNSDVKLFFFFYFSHCRRL